MKTAPKLYLTLSFLTLTATASFGYTYDYSYNFINGTTVAGVLEGTSSGGSVDVTGVDSLLIDGTAVSGQLYAAGYTQGSGGSTFSSAPVISLSDPINNNFIFTTDLASPESGSYFLMLPGGNDIPFLGGIPFTVASNGANEETFSSNFSLTAVPEPSVSALMLLPGGFYAFRRFSKRIKA